MVSQNLTMRGWERNTPKWTGWMEARWMSLSFCMAKHLSLLIFLGIWVNPLALLKDAFKIWKAFNFPQRSMLWTWSWASWSSLGHIWGLSVSKLFVEHRVSVHSGSRICAVCAACQKVTNVPSLIAYMKHCMRLTLTFHFPLCQVRRSTPPWS